MPAVFFILCHHSADKVADLLRQIWRPDHHYILHADGKSAASLGATVDALAAAFPNVHALPSAACSWGGWSLVETTLRGIDHALTLPGGWSHFIPLSESHVALVPPEDAVGTLEDGVSYLDAQPFSAMHGNGRADVLHRFAARYREVPGVGMFAAGPRRLPPEFLTVLRHGSQWLILARDACERLHARRGDAALWEPFRTSLLADETALQTLLLAETGRGLTIRHRATTFIGWPHLSGNDDTTFSERNFHDAPAQGFLFIRKRPAVLPDSVTRALARLYRTDLPKLPVPDETFTGGPRVAPYATALLRALQPRFPGLEALTLSPLRAGGSPTCYLQFRTRALPPALSVALLSDDMVHFKVVLAWLRDVAHDYRTGTLGGYPTSLLKTRLWKLFLQREVILPDLPGGGFVTLATGATLAWLTAPIAHALDAGAGLAPAVAAGG